jgi:hypothetical protein
MKVRNVSVRISCILGMEVEGDEVKGCGNLLKLIGYLGHHW